MLKVLLKRFRRVWMIGIAGSGMCGIAEVLLALGFKVSGSDLIENDVSVRLCKLGANVKIGHKAAWVKNADVVIYSSAVQSDNVELLAAGEKGIPMIRRSEMLAELMRLKTGIAISGSHGKTSVTSLIGEIAEAGNLDPMVIVGGRLKKLGGGVKSGSGEIMIAEADEYDKSFLRLSPVIVLINNIDNDHIECYGTYKELEQAFVTFANSIPFYGRAFVNLDEKALFPIIKKITRPIITFGFSPQSDIKAIDPEYLENRSKFKVIAYGKLLGEVNLTIPGRFNILNALGAIAIANELGIKFSIIKSTLEEFSGVLRRFEIIEEINQVLVVTDFGHHPTEIAATLIAAKEGWKRRIITVFQAHLFSRTQALAEQFGQSLLESDVAFVLPIYPAREKPIPGVTGELIYKAALKLGHKDIHYLEDKKTAAREVVQVSKPGDIIVVMGAGTVDQLIPEIVELLKQK